MTDLFSDRPNPWVGPLYPLDSDFERAGELADLQFLHGDPDYDPLFDPDFVRDDINRDGISLEEATVLARLRVSPLREPRRTGPSVVGPGSLRLRSRAGPRPRGVRPQAVRRHLRG